MKGWYVVGAGSVVGAIAAAVVVSAHHHPASYAAKSPSNNTVAANSNSSSGQGSTQTNGTASSASGSGSNGSSTSSGSSGSGSASSNSVTGNTTGSSNATDNSTAGTTGSANSTASTNSSSAQIQTVMNTVQQMLQQPTPKKMDASKFVQYVFQQGGVNLPRTVQQQAQVGTQISTTANLQPGDLVFFDLGNTPNTPTFDGVYIGNNQFAALTTHGLMAIKLSQSYWAGHYLYGQRVA